MNKNRHPIDDLFRDGLDQHSVEPPMHVWDRIDQTRTPVYKLMNNFRQNSRWYLSIATGMVLMSSAAVMFLSDKPENKLASHTGMSTAPTQTEIIQNAPISNSVKDNTTQSFTEISKTELPANESIATAVSGSSRTQNSNTPKDKSLSSPQENRSTEPVPLLDMNNAGSTLSPVENKNLTDGKEPNQADMATPAPSIPKAESPEKLTIEPKTIDPEKLPVASEETAATVKTEDVSGAPPIEASPWSIEFLGSYDFVNRRVFYADPAYLSARKQDEKIGAAYSFQLRGQYRINPILALRTGISFSRIHEKLNHTKVETYDEIVERQETGWIMDPINGPIQISYTVKDTISRSSSTQTNSNNKYTFLDIPILLNYSLYASNNWTLGVSGGPMINFVFQQKGFILAPTNENVIDLNSSANPYRTYAGLNLMLNFSAAYKLNSHFDILVEPGMRMGISSLTTTPMGMTQKYNSLNLFTGLRYNF